MSAGNFLRAFYTRDNGEVANIRIQPETAAIAFAPGGTNVIPSGAGASGIVRVSGGRRGYTKKARLVYLSSPSAPTGYKDNSPIALPVLTPQVFNAIPDTGGKATYLGVEWDVIGKSPESGKG